LLPLGLLDLAASLLTLRFPLLDGVTAASGGY